jgi:UDP-2,3-diacylglucosamine pyrophosphatase LpxH
MVASIPINGVVTRPIFCVSDLHMGDGGARDNFAHMSGGHREREFHQFLDYVQYHRGHLFILGDLFELWQGNISRVITYRMGLLDRLANMHATYILGNHDIDLKYFTSTHGLMLSHPLFCDLPLSKNLVVGGKTIRLIHGHEQDKYCQDESPGVGRISAIYAGRKEDRNGGPMKDKYRTIESQTMSRLSRWTRLARKCLGIQDQGSATRAAILAEFLAGKANALVFGHTHEPGQFAYPNGVTLPIYNCGSWCEQVPSFVRIEADGEKIQKKIQVLDWRYGSPRINSSTLKVTQQ